MLVCPFCREVNPEGLRTCEHCGKELRPGRHAMTSVRRERPVEIEPPPPVPSGPRWGRIVALAVVVAGIAGGATWLSLRPQPCDGRYSSSLFAYCVQVPSGWSASTAQIGATDVDQFVRRPATAVVMALPLRPGVTLAQYAQFALQQVTAKGLASGPVETTSLGGSPALQWDLSVKGGRFQGVEVVTVRDGVGWTVQLDDDEATFPSHLRPFRSMLASFLFR